MFRIYIIGCVDAHILIENQWRREGLWRPGADYDMAPPTPTPPPPPHRIRAVLVAILVEVLSPSSGVSRISARGVLKLRPDTKSGEGGGGGGGGGGVLSVSCPIRKAGGGVGGECCRFLARYEKRGGGGGEGCCRFLARYKKRKGGGGGGGAIGLWPNASAYPECAGGGC